MSSKDAEWLKLCERHRDKYHIVVDNDEVYVVETETGNEKHTFSEFGWRFALDLLHYYGIEAEEA